jgi:hypothetical protein
VRKARQRASTPVEIDQSEAMIAEVDSEEFNGEIRVPFAGATLSIPPQGRWRLSATNALRTGDFTTWAHAVMSADDAATFIGLDPTLDEVNEFFAELGRITGVTLGEARPSRRGSVRTGRR